ncbi:MAG: VanZ family protein [Bacteroidales bacterium]|nr:VanZ family protein [Bacteroidales bacterium]
MEQEKTSITLPNDIHNFILLEMCELLKEGKAVKMMFGGTSMLPLIHGDGDKITLRPMSDDEDCVPFEIYMFVLNGHFIIHRLMRIDGDVLVFQGDNCYHYERVSREDVLAKLTILEKKDGISISVESDQFRTDSRRVLRRKRTKQFVVKLFNQEGRKRLAALYFILLAILMWAPLNGLGLVLNNHIFGLRLDHLLHACIYVVCPLFLADWLDKRAWRILISALIIGFITEFGQAILPYRGYDVNDLVANCVGNILGWLGILSMLVRHNKIVSQQVNRNN